MPLPNTTLNYGITTQKTDPYGGEKTEARRTKLTKRHTIFVPDILVCSRGFAVHCFRNFFEFEVRILHLLQSRNSKSLYQEILSLASRMRVFSLILLLFKGIIFAFRYNFCFLCIHF